MRKNKTWEVNFDGRITQTDDDIFFSNDTEAYLTFRPTATELTFDSAEIVLLNKDDGSLVKRSMIVGNNFAEYEIEPDIMIHFGFWQAQAIFKQADEVASVVPVTFTTKRYMMHERQPSLTEYQSVTEFLNENNLKFNELFDETKAFVDQIEGFTLESFVDNKMGEELQNIEVNYATRLTGLESNDANLTAQLAQKANKDEAMLISSGVGLDNINPELLAAIEGGEGTSFNLLSIPRERSVQPQSTTFFDISSNLFDQNDAVLGKGIDPATGDLIDNATAFTSAPIVVSENTQYTLDGVGFRMAFYNSQNEFIYPTLLRNNDGAYTLTTPPETSIMRVSAGRGQLGRMVVNRGSSLLPYEPYYSHLKGEVLPDLSDLITLKDEYVTPEKTNFFKFTTNLFNTKEVILKKNVDSATGLIVDSTTNFVSNKIPVSPNSDYVLFSPTTRATLYNSDDVMIWTGVVSTATNLLLIETTGATSYIIVSGNEARIPALQLNKGSEPLPYEEYHEPYIAKGHLDKDISSNISKPYYLAPNMPIGTVDPTDSVEALDGTGPNGLINLDIGVSDVYGWYDELMALYPKYITREQIGTDASGQYPIYVFSFDADDMLEMPYTSTYKPKPKLILGTGMHGRDNMGDPNNSIYTLYWFMKDICEQNQSSEWFSYLRNSVTFKIIPLQNPWAVQNATRKNSNGVDINRNFDTPTWRSGTPTGTDYGGTTPFSEPESRALRDYVIANNDAKLVMDFHTVGTLYEHGKWMYFEFPTGSELFNIANTHVKTMSSKWKTKNYPLDDSEYYGYVYNTLAGKYQEWVNTEMGILSAVLEGAPHIPNTDEPRDSQNVMDMYYDSMSNWITHFIQHLK